MSATNTESAQTDQPDPGGRPSRRSVLLGVGAVGAIAATTALAACASSGTGTTATNGAASTADPGSATSATSPAGATTTPTTPAGASGGLTPTSAIPVGGGKIFADQEIVVTQPTKGEFKAFTAICTHMGCTVGSISNGLIMCPCHGSEYSIVDGSVKQGPAPRPLAAKQVKVTNGEISVTG